MLGSRLPGLACCLSVGLWAEIVCKVFEGRIGNGCFFCCCCCLFPCCAQQLKPQQSGK